MIFVVSNEFTSSRLRGNHIAAALKVPCLFSDLGNARNDKVVFVKDADRGLVQDAVERGNEVIYDPLDYFTYKDRAVTFGDLVDVVIVPNTQCTEFYRTVFPKARFALIPHQWDESIVAQAPQDRCRVGYIGKPFNCLPGFDGAMVTKSPDMVAAAPLFNLHISLNQRTERQILLKPATKIATASAVLANVVTYPDPSAIELLGSEYPYIAIDDPAETVREAALSFGSAKWKFARDRMRFVKERTKLSATAMLYARLADGEKQIREAA